DQRILNEPAQLDVLQRDEFTVAEAVTVSRFPVAGDLWLRRVALPGEVPLAAVPCLIDQLVRQDLLRDIPTVLAIEGNVFVGREKLPLLMAEFHVPSPAGGMSTGDHERQRSSCSSVNTVLFQSSRAYSMVNTDYQTVDQ